MDVDDVSGIVSFPHQLIWSSFLRKICRHKKSTSSSLDLKSLRLLFSGYCYLVELDGHVNEDILVANLPRYDIQDSSIV